MSLIRTYSFLRYAEINLEDARKAMASRQYEDAYSKGREAIVAMTKAVDAALPGVDADFFAMKQPSFERHLRDLMPDSSKAAELAEILCSCREQNMGEDEKEDGELAAESHCQSLLFSVQKGLQLLEQAFPNRLHPLKQAKQGR